MRILFITHFFPPTHTAGTENYTFSLAIAFHKRGYDVEVLCAEDWDIGDSYWNGVSLDKFNGVTVRRIHLNWQKAKDPNRILFDNQLVERWLDVYLKGNNFDLVHVTSTYSLGVGVLRSIKRAGLPLVLTLMDFWFICPSHQLYRSNGDLCDGDTSAWECDKCLLGNSHLFQEYTQLKFPDQLNGYIWRTLSRLPVLSKRRGMRGMLLNMKKRKQLLGEAILLPDVVISHSITVKEYVRRIFSIPIERITLGSDLSWLNNCCDKTPNNKVRFGYIGQIHKTKGVHLLVNAFVQAELEGKAYLEVWGNLKDNDYVNELKKLVGDSRSIKLHGRFEHGGIGNLLSELDVLVVPSLWYENSPLVIKEAFATMTPVITANLGGMAEAVTDGVDGLLFSPGDVTGLARQLTRIVEDPKILNNLRKGIMPVKTIEVEIDELVNIYQAVIEKNNKAKILLKEI